MGDERIYGMKVAVILLFNASTDSPNRELSHAVKKLAQYF